MHFSRGVAFASIGAMSLDVARRLSDSAMKTSDRLGCRGRPHDRIEHVSAKGFVLPHDATLMLNQDTAAQVP